MKPPGIAMTLGPEGIGMHVTRSSRAEDLIWDAVQEAVMANMTPQRFMREVYQAWDYERDEQRKTELKELGK